MIIFAMLLTTSALAAPDRTSDDIETTDEDGVKLVDPGTRIEISEDGIELIAPDTQISISQDGVFVDGQQVDTSDFSFTIGENMVKGSGKRASVTRELGDFHRVDVRGSVDVAWSPGKQSQANVTADDNLLDLIVTEIDGDTLIVRTEGSYSSKVHQSVVLTGRTLDGVEIHGSGDLSAAGIDADTFDIEIRGSGDVEVAGRVEQLSVEVRGSGDVEAADLHASRADIEVSGSGDVAVHATESANVDIRGSGDVEVTGGAEVDQNIRGSGDIHIQ